jgi:hypothetical protein
MGERDAMVKWFTQRMGEMLKETPEITDRTTRAITESMMQMAKSVTEGMRAVYAPMQAGTDAAGDSSLGDVITPWYGGPDGGIDTRDPTDFLQGVAADGADYAGSVIADDDSEPFGVPGLGIDPAVPPRGQPVNPSTSQGRP